MSFLTHLTLNHPPQHRPHVSAEMVQIDRSTRSCTTASTHQAGLSLAPTLDERRDHRCTDTLLDGMAAAVYASAKPLPADEIHTAGCVLTRLLRSRRRQDDAGLAPAPPATSPRSASTARRVGRCQAGSEQRPAAHSAARHLRDHLRRCHRPIAAVCNTAPLTAATGRRQASIINVVLHRLLDRFVDAFVEPAHAGLSAALATIGSRRPDLHAARASAIQATT